jgi:ATP-dependent Clp protease protease subunit
MRLHFEIDKLITAKQEDLIEEPVIVVVNKFDEEAVADFQEDMDKAHLSGQSIIPVVIDSYGGQVYSLMSMITVIQNSKKPVATIVEGKAMSCGAILFSFGAEGHRYVSEHATVMIHDVSHGAYGKVEETKARTVQAEKLNDKVYRMMAKNCGQPEDHFLKIVHSKGHADWYLDAKECKKHKLANHIRVPELVTKVTVSMLLA